MVLILDFLILNNEKAIVLRNNPVYHDCNKILQSVIDKPKGEGTKSYGFKENQIFVHLLYEKDFTFLCLCTPEMAAERAFRFLNAVSEKATEKLSATQSQKTKESTQLENYVDGLIKFYGDEQIPITKLDILKKEALETSALYVQNLEDILDRGKKIEELKRKTDILRQGSGGVTSGYRKLEEKKVQQLKKIKCKKIRRGITISIAFIFSALLLALIFLLYLCGGYHFSACRRK